MYWAYGQGGKSNLDCRSSPRSSGPMGTAAIASHRMTATVQLTVEEIKDLCDLTGTDSAEGAVRSALDEYRRYARRMRLKEVSGQLTIMENWGELEAAETDENRPH